MRSAEGEGMSDKAYNLLPTMRARDLRNGSTTAERKLWGALSNRKIEGVRFNRQVPVGPFICDFVARSTKLVIELDGGQHGENSNYDARRTLFLEARGYHVLRFWNDDVFRNLDGVIMTIIRVLQDTPSPSRLCRSSPPAPAGGA